MATVFCLPRWLLGFWHVHMLARPFPSVHVFWRRLPNPHSFWVHMYVDALFAQDDTMKSLVPCIAYLQEKNHQKTRGAMISIQ